jgi:hypothetical protein
MQLRHRRLRGLAPHEGLLGDDTRLDPREMDMSLAFVATLRPPPVGVPDLVLLLFNWT